MNIDKSKLKTGIWYEDKNGNYIPVRESGLVGELPENAWSAHTMFPLEVRESVTFLRDDAGNRIEKDHKPDITWSTHIGGGNSDVILGMANSGDYTLGEAIAVFARACERCMNVLAYKYTNGKDGYPEFSEEWHKAGTMCDFCKGEG